MNICELSPNILWKFFSEISGIPRPFTHEEKIGSYLEKFARDRHLEYSRDAVGNLVIRKKASADFETRVTVILQTHMDMVPQKTEESLHDFLKDPLQLLIDGDWVKAKDTTLGADNGIGMAAVLSVLDSNTIVHGPLEALFTVDEESKLTGASNLDSSMLTGTIFLNLDSEEQHRICIGCAGARETALEWTYVPQEPTPNSVCFSLHISGVRGGHSGLDIHPPRANAIKVIARILNALDEKVGIELGSLDGGTLSNTIPRNAQAQFWIKENKLSEVKDLVAQEQALLVKEFLQTDPELFINLKSSSKEISVLDKKTQTTLFDCLLQVPNGVLQMHATLRNTVETSTNLAIVSVQEGKIIVRTLHRSLIDSELVKASHDVAQTFTLVPAQVRHIDLYPSWQLDPSSPLLKLVKDIFQEVHQRQPEIYTVHAGLECGLIKKHFSNLDMISIGPEIQHPHTPSERVNIASVERFWNFLLEILKGIVEK